MATCRRAGSHGYDVRSRGEIPPVIVECRSEHAVAVRGDLRYDREDVPVLDDHPVVVETEDVDPGVVPVARPDLAFALFRSSWSSVAIPLLRSVRSTSPRRYRRASDHVALDAELERGPARHRRGIVPDPPVRRGPHRRRRRYRRPALPPDRRMQGRAGRRRERPRAARHQAGPGGRQRAHP